MALFGLNGFVIGPVIAALFIAAWDLFAAPERVRAEEAEEAEDAALKAQAVAEAQEKAEEKAEEKAKAKAAADA